MTPLGTFILAQAQSAEDESSNFLVSPNIGLMIWTLLAFIVAFLILRKYAWPPITAALEKAKVQREELLEQTRRDIEAETRRAIQEIRNEVADLTVLATEKVTRKSLDEDDQKRLVEEALSELDFESLSKAAR